MSDFTLSSIQRDVIRSIKQTNFDVDRTQLSLASGKRVQSALDNPQNFFESNALTKTANDLNRLLDGISKSIRTIEETNTGVETMLRILDQIETLVEDGLLELFPAPDEVPDPEAIQYLIDRNPDKAYFADTNNFYQNTTDFASWSDASARAAAAGIEGAPELKGHLATITSQEENDFVFALLTSSSWLGGSDNEVEGEWRWVEGPEAGEQFWQGLAGGTATNGFYTNWAGGEPNQFFGPGNPENYAHMRPDGTWNDLPNSNTLNYIIEWGGDLLIDNPDINVSSDSVRYRKQFLELMTQLQDITNDASFRGIRLLQGDDLQTQFNVENRSSRLETEGIDATNSGLGLKGDNFISKAEMGEILIEIRKARETLRDYSSSLQSDLNIIKSRDDFIENSINTLKNGSDDLVVGDMNEKGAEMLALQTRQVIQFEVLSLTINDNILDLFS